MAVTFIQSQSLVFVAYSYSLTKMVEKKPISELPPSTVQLITATQIATSVSNIIKELVENSMDAGATVIRVKLVSFILIISMLTYIYNLLFSKIRKTLASAK